MKAYNKNMGGVDLAELFLALYLVSVKTKRWFIGKVFWYLLDITKVNDWILYKRHRVQLSIPQTEKKTLLDFSCKLAESLIKANKTVASSFRGRPTKRKSDVAKKEVKSSCCHSVL